jgi:selenocysteine lyase/cysteine desulfurase
VPLPDDALEEFPISAEATYLNHAASAPLPARAATALRRYVDDRQRLVHLYQTGTQDYDATALRNKLARLLNATVEGIGFVPTTTDGIGAVINGLEWRPGDNIVVPANDFPGVLYACLHLGRRGGIIRQVAPKNGHLDLDELLSAVDDRSRAVVVSHVHWQTGHRIDLAKLGHACRARGVLSIVDAIQSLGAMPIDVGASAIDVLVAGTYKWLCGIHGLAVLYLSDRALAAVVPDRAGWASMRTSVYAEPALEFAPDATRFAVGGASDGALTVLDQSVELLLEIGIPEIAAHTIGLVERLASRLDPDLVTINSSGERSARSSILNITTGDRERDRRLVRSLAGQGIIVAHRGPGIRVSPHLHNSAADIDRLVAAIDESR